MVHRRLATTNPFGTFVAIGGVIIGILAAFIGDDISLGMSRSLHNSANYVAHTWGFFFALGGVLKISGLYRRKLVTEIPGLWMLAGGYGFYAVTVAIGLGFQGVVAAIVSGCIALGCVNKAVHILNRAKRFGVLERGLTDAGRD